MESKVFDPLKASLADELDMRRGYSEGLHRVQPSRTTEAYRYGYRNGQRDAA